MSFAKLSNDILKQNQVQEKINWPGLMAAGLMALPGKAADFPQQKEKPAIQQTIKSDINFKDIVGTLKRFENSKNYPKGNYNKKLQKWFIYDDRGKQAIAYGHNLSEEEIAKKTFVNGITDEQATQVLLKDIERKRQETSGFIPKLNTFPEELQNAIIVATFRGDLKKQHNTTKLINQGKFIEAADEFLNHKEYQNAPTNSELRKRLEGISNELRKYGESLKKPVAVPKKSQ